MTATSTTRPSTNLHQTLFPSERIVLVSHIELEVVAEELFLHLVAIAQIYPADRRYVGATFLLLKWTPINCLPTTEPIQRRR